MRWVWPKPPMKQMQRGTIRAGHPVAASPLKAACDVGNWLIGHGVPLVVDGGKTLYANQGGVGQSWTFRYYVRSSSVFTTFTLLITASGHYYRPSSSEEVPGESVPVTFYDHATVRVTVAGYPFTVSEPTRIMVPLENTLGDAPGEITFTVETFQSQYNQSLPGPEDVYVNLDSVLVFETPEVLLQGIEGTEPIESKQQIYDGYLAYESLAGLERLYGHLLWGEFRRGALFSYFFPFAIDLTQTSYTSLFPVSPTLQTRMMFSGETTRKVSVAVLAQMNSVNPAHTGNVRITMTNGSTHTFNYAGGGALAWQVYNDLLVETDDPSRWDTDGGIRGGTRDVMTVEHRATAPWAIRILGICVFDVGGG